MRPPELPVRYSVRHGFCVFLANHPIFPLCLPNSDALLERCWEDSDPAACFRSLRDLPHKLIYLPQYTSYATE